MRAPAAQVVAVELALDLAAFEQSVGVNLNGDLTGLLSTEADAVRTFAADAAADVEVAFEANSEAGAIVTCLYRLQDAARLNLLTLDNVCVAPRVLQADANWQQEDAARRMDSPDPAASGIGTIIELDTLLNREVTLGSVEISSGDVSIQADANVVIVGGGVFAPQPPEALEPEVKDTSNALLAVALGGALLCYF